MRYIKEIPNALYKIGLYQWNNKYIIKIESGMYEQTYKIDDYEVASPDEIVRCMDDALMEAITKRFNVMHDDFSESLRRNEVIF